MSYYPDTFQSQGWHTNTSDQIYPVIERNRRYLAGEVSHISAGFSVKVPFFVALVLFVAIGIALFFEIPHWFQTQDLAAHGVPIQATVTKQHVDADSDSTTYYLTYSFTTPNNGATKGKTFTNESEVNQDTYNRYAIKSLVGVIYLPADPTVSEIPNQDSFPKLLFYAIFAMLPIGLIIFGFWTLRLNRLLERKGTIIPAEVFALKGYTDDGDKKLKITYMFMTPEGQVITRDKRVDQTDYTSAINRSTRLGVLYHNQKRFRLL